MFIIVTVTALTETAVDPAPLPPFVLACNRTTSYGFELTVEDNGRNVSIN
jgi:hypothetical protein